MMQERHVMESASRRKTRLNVFDILGRPDLDQVAYGIYFAELGWVGPPELQWATATAVGPGAVRRESE